MSDASQGHGTNPTGDRNGMEQEMETDTKRRANRKRFLLMAGAGVLALVVAAAAILYIGTGAGRSADQGPESLEGSMGAMEEGLPQDASMQDAPIQEGPLQDGAMEGGGSMEGMDMGGSGAIRLTSDEVSTFGITFGTADVRPLTRTIRAVGMVDFDETRMSWVAPKFGGWAERLHVDFTGQPVRAGQPLLDVYSPELVTAQEELLLAQRMARSLEGSRVGEAEEGANELLASARRRLSYWDISEEQVDRVVETGEVQKTLTLHAPVSGVVMEKDVFEGQAFQPGRNLYMIADLSEVWVNAEIFESDVGFVREGMPAEVTVAALPGEPITGTIEYVYPTLEERTRSMRVRIAVPNPGGELKPGMYATAELTAELPEALTIPSSAVLRTGERAVAFVNRGGGEILPREVRLGAQGAEHVQVLDGLEAGDRVVTSAQFLLDSESNLAEVMQAMMAQMNMSDMEGMDMDMEEMEGMEDVQAEEMEEMERPTDADSTVER